MSFDDGLDAYLLTIPWRRQPDGPQRRDALSEVLEQWGRPVDANALARWLAYRHHADTIDVITDQWHDVQVRARGAWDHTDVLVRLEGEVLSEALTDVLVVLRWLERLPRNVLAVADTSERDDGELPARRKRSGRLIRRHDLEQLQSDPDNQRREDP